MELPKCNGEIDLEVVADMIVSKMISELDAISTTKEREHLRNYVNGILIDIISESKQRDDLRGKLAEFRDGLDEILKQI